MQDSPLKGPGGVPVKPQELIDIIRAAAGVQVSYLKLGDIEIQFGTQRKQPQPLTAQANRPAPNSAGADWYNQEPPVSAIDA